MGSEGKRGRGIKRGAEYVSKRQSRGENQKRGGLRNDRWKQNLSISNL